MLLLSACNFQMPQSVRQETESPGERAKVPPVAKSTPPNATKEADSPVAAVAKPDPEIVRAGEAFTLVVDVQVDAGWHIYAIDRYAGPARPTAITFELPKSLQWENKWTSPDPSLETSYGAEPCFVHEGKLAFRRRVRSARDAASGRLTLHGTLRYQACDRFSCRAPAELTLQTELNIVR